MVFSNSSITTTQHHTLSTVNIVLNMYGVIYDVPQQLMTDYAFSVYTRGILIADKFKASSRCPLPPRTFVMYSGEFGGERHITAIFLSPPS